MENGVSDWVGVLFCLVVCITLYYLTGQKLAPLWQHYRFSGEGIDILIFGGKVKLLRIKRGNIRDAVVMSGFRARLQNPLAVSAQNRIIAKRVLLVRTTGLSYILTPDNPEEALEVLGF